MEKLGFSKTSPAQTGRPPYTPQDMLKLYIYGYFNRVRSSRRLEAETKRNIEVMWLLKTLTPNHKTISRFRKENSDALKNTFRAFVKMCDKIGLYGKELLSVDSSKFSACNSKERNFTKSKLIDRIRRIEEKLEKYLKQLDTCDEEEEYTDKNTANITSVIKSLSERKEKYSNLLEDIEEKGEPQVSLTDPDSRLMNTANHNSKVAYNVQTAVDGKNGMIAEFKVTNSSVDKGQIHDISNKVKNLLGIEEMTVIADKGYDSPADIMKFIQSGIEANICMDADFLRCVLKRKKRQKNQSGIQMEDVYI